MKLDQETVVKHQFWFLLGGYFFLWLIAILWMKFSYPGQIEDLKKKYDGAASAVKTQLSSGPVNTATFLPPWVKEAQLFNDHKSVIWKAAWDVQKDMYDWPQEWYKKYDMTVPQVPLSSDDLTEYKDKLYPNEIANLRTYAPKWLSPVELKDGFDSVLNPKKDWKETPTREEVWLAQEDVWVKRELLIDVYKAMAWQALMDPLEIDEKKDPISKGVEARFRFVNKNWEITLNLRKSDKGLVIGGDSTIKNIHPSRHPQALTSAKGRGIWFNIVQENNVRTTFEVRGEPVSWNETKNFSDENYPDPLGSIKWDKEYLKEHPIFVSQGFDQTNCPIRRINAIELPKQDCRTFIWPLQPNHQLAQLDALPEEEKKADASTGGAGGAGMMGGGAGASSSASGPMGSMGMRAPGLAGMPGAAAAPSGNKTPNNEIERNRYLQPASQDKSVNPPSRHLPLALQLIVEQSHMHDIMLALANSRLRFQITQVEFQHEKNYTPQSDGDKDKKDGKENEDPRVFTGGMPSMGGSGGSGGMAARQMMMRTQMQRMQQMGRGGMGGTGSSAMRSPAMPGGPGMPPNAGAGTMRGGPAMPNMAGGSNPMMRPPGPAGMPIGAGQMRNSYLSAPGALRGALPTASGVTPNQSASNQQDDNLIELTIYGIATLYRAPDVPQTTSPTAQPAAPAGQPAAPVAPTSGATPPTPQAGAATPPPAATTPPSGASTPSGTAAPPKDAPKDGPKDGSPPPAPKQPDKAVDPQKTPPPPPPAGNKR